MKNLLQDKGQSFTAEEVRKMVHMRVFEYRTYQLIGTMMHRPPSSVRNAIKWYCGKIYTDYVAGTPIQTLCYRFNYDEREMKLIIRNAKEFFHIKPCSRVY